jgi:hypothetical protein
MTCTYDLIIITESKEVTCYSRSHVFGGKDALNKRFYPFNCELVYLQKMDQTVINLHTCSWRTSTHVPTYAHNRPAPTCPLKFLQTNQKQPK